MFLVHPTVGGKKLSEVSPQAAEFVDALATSTDGRVDKAAPLLQANGSDRWAPGRKVKSGSA